MALVRVNLPPYHGARRPPPGGHSSSSTTLVETVASGPHNLGWLSYNLAVTRDVEPGLRSNF